MLATKTLPQLDSKQRTLIAIALTLTDRLSPTEAASTNVSRIKDYQIWRDRHNVAIVNTKTHQLVVFGTVTSQFEPEDIVSQDLWKGIHHCYGDFSPVITQDEIESAWQFLRPLDPTIQNLYQVRQYQPDYSIKTAVEEKRDKFSQIEKIFGKLEHLRSIFCAELNKSAV